MLTVLALIACMTGPGILAVPYIRLPCAERLPLVVAISATATFLVTWICFLFDLPAWTAIVWCGGCAIAALAGWQTWQRLLQRPSAQFCLCGTLLTTLVVLLLQSSTFAYHGGGWTGDWFEHYQRAEFFLDRDNPLEARFLPPVNYLLPARPPLFNVIAAHIMAVTGRTFANYQIIAGVLNSLLCLPLLALTIRFLRVAGVRRLPGLTAVNAAIVLLPSFMQNATFPWTKSLTSFFVLTALLQVSHLGALDRGGFRRGGLIGMLLAAAVLTHYSALVYVVVIGSWLCWWAFLQRPRNCLGIIGGGLLCGLPLVAVWLSYVALVFGWEAIFGTTSAYADAAGLGWQENLKKILQNLYDTVVPHYFRSRPVVVSTLMQQPSWLGQLRDYWFLPLQVNFPSAVGTLAPITLIGIGLQLASHWPQQQSQRLSRFFWVWVFTAGIFLGVAVHGGRDAAGLAHICLQPLILVAAAAIMSWLPRLPRLVQLVGLTGIAFDAIVGIGLQNWLQYLPIEIAKTIGPDGVHWVNDRGLSIVATDSVFAKKMLRLVFLTDTISARSLPLLAAATSGCLAFGGLLWALSRTSVRSANTGE